MPCFHPLAGVRIGYHESGKPKYNIVSMTDKCLDDFPPEDVIQIPCGKCLGCRLQYGQDWQGRLLMEQQCHDSSLFVTLTYDEEHVHYVIVEDDAGSFIKLETLWKKDIQDFMKRLRYHFKEDKIKYFICGEYGDQTHRCHAHGIIFGLHLDDLEEIKGAKGVNGEQKYFSPVFNAIWGNGQTEIGTVTPASCSYVSRYVTKKVRDGVDERLSELGLQPEFALMSRNPAIGRNYFDAHPRMFDHISYNLPTEKGPVKIYPTRYFRQLVDDDQSKIMRKVAGRKKRASSLIATDVGYLDHLAAQESIKKAQTKIILNRSID